MIRLQRLSVVGLTGFLLSCSWQSSSPPAPEFAKPHEHPTGRVSDKLPNTVLLSQDGEQLRFYEDLVKDKIVVIQFMYTTCTGI